MLNKSKITTSLALLTIATAGLAHAEPEKRTSTDKDLLRGPDVTQTTKNRTNQTDSMTNKREQRTQGEREGKRAQRGPATGPVKLQEFQAAIRQLMNDKSEQELGLSGDQRKQIKAIITEQREAANTYREEHKEEFTKIREELKAEREAMRANREGQSKEQMSEQGTKERKQSPAQEKMQEFLERSPANGKALEEIKAVLTTEQLTAVKARIETIRTKRANSQGRQRLRSTGQRPNDDARQERTRDDSQTERPKGPKAHRKKMNSDNARPSGNKEAKQQKGKPRNGKDG